MKSINFLKLFEFIVGKEKRLHITNVKEHLLEEKKNQ